MSVSEFSASRWTAACGKSGKGRNSERPSELGEGRCKNKAEKEHKRKWGEVQRTLKFLWRKRPLKPYQVCRMSVRESYWRIKCTIW